MSTLLQLFVKPKSHEIFVTVGLDKDHCLQGIWASICQKIPIPINTPPKNLWSGNPPSRRFTLLHRRRLLTKSKADSAILSQCFGNSKGSKRKLYWIWSRLRIALKSFKGSSVTWLHSLTSSVVLLLKFCSNVTLMWICCKAHGLPEAKVYHNNPPFWSSVPLQRLL